MIFWNSRGIFATFSSGCYYLLASDTANFLLFSMACFLDGCIGPLYPDALVSLPRVKTFELFLELMTQSTETMRPSVLHYAHQAG